IPSSPRAGHWPAGVFLDHPIRKLGDESHRTPQGWRLRTAADSVRVAAVFYWLLVVGLSATYCSTAGDASRSRFLFRYNQSSRPCDSYLGAPLRLCLPDGRLLRREFVSGLCT